MNCRRTRNSIDALFLGQRPGRWSEVARHSAQCDGCGNYYQRAVVALRAAHGAPLEVSPEELALAAPAVSRPRSSARGAVVPALAALALSAVAVIVVRVPETDEVRSRGTAPARAEATLRAHCVREAGGRYEIVASSAAPSVPLRCRLGDLLQFSYTLRSDRQHYLYLGATDARGNLLVYWPRGTEGDAVVLPPTAGEEPLAGSIRLAARHTPGTFQVLGAVGERPISAAEFDAMQNGETTREGVQLLTLRLEVVP